MRCLVTGVAGFVGSHLSERLIAEGHEVIDIDAFFAQDEYSRTLKEANLQRLHDSNRFRCIDADLTTLPLEPLLADREWVFHQAAQAGVRTSWGRSLDLYTANNITATQRLLEAAQIAPLLWRLVYASSSSVYGEVTTLPVTEETPTHPVSPYGVTKLTGEHLCQLYWRGAHLSVVVLRYFTVYGPRQRPDMAFHRFGRALLEGRKLAIFGDAAQTRDFTYVGDAVAANIQAAAAPDIEGKVFNIGGGTRVSVSEVVTLLEELSGFVARLDYGETARGAVRDTSADTSSAQRWLGYTPVTPLQEGLAVELAYLAELYCKEPNL